MGVDYRAMLYVGKEFESSEDAENFIRERVGFTDEEERDIEDVGLEELLCCENRFNLDGSFLDCYTGYGFLVGTELSIQSPETFVQQVKEAHANWNALFPNDPAELIHTVKIY